MPIIRQRHFFFQMTFAKKNLSFNMYQLTFFYHTIYCTYIKLEYPLSLTHILKYHIAASGQIKPDMKKTIKDGVSWNTLHTRENRLACQQVLFDFR